METNNAFETAGYIFQWKIENVSSLWWLDKGEIRSQSFIADALDGTKWSLGWYPTEKEYYDNDLCLYRTDCSGPHVIDVNYKFEVLLKDKQINELNVGSKGRRFLRGECEMFNFCPLRNLRWHHEKEVLFPEDTLTIRCIIWKGQELNIEKNKILYGRTVLEIKRQYFVWRIDEFSNFKSSFRTNFKDSLVDIDLILKAPLDSSKNFSIGINSFHESIKYFSFIVSISDSVGSEICVGKNKYSFIDAMKVDIFCTLHFPEKWFENINLRAPNNSLSLDFEFVFSTAKSINCRENSKFGDVGGKEKSLQMPVLADDLKSMYNEGLCSDLKLCTVTQTFSVHKAILSARSPVFRQMFSCNMKENIGSHVQITDLEDDTVHQMLLYMYTDFLDHLQFESLLKLYVAADKYDILTLKKKCCLLLEENLQPTNACNVLILAIRHHDGDLTNVVQNYILTQSKSFFCLQEWKDFMKIHEKLALNILYKMIMQ